MMMDHRPWSWAQTTWYQQTSFTTSRVILTCEEAHACMTRGMWRKKEVLTRVKGVVILILIINSCCKCAASNSFRRRIWCNNSIVAAAAAAGFYPMAVRRAIAPHTHHSWGGSCPACLPKKKNAQGRARTTKHWETRVRRSLRRRRKIKWREFFRVKNDQNKRRDDNKLVTTLWKKSD